MWWTYIHAKSVILENVEKDIDPNKNVYDNVRPFCSYHTEGQFSTITKITPAYHSFILMLDDSVKTLTKFKISSFQNPEDGPMKIYSTSSVLGTFRMLA